MNNNCLLVFLKYPRLGEVKTRLANTVGESRALEVYRRLCHIIFEQCVLLRKDNVCEVYLYCSKEEDVGLTETWTNNTFLYDYQVGEDLGERLNNAFAALSEKGYEKIVVIGTDTPQLTRHTVIEAFDILDTFDCVVGESYDGGYYLFGTKKYLPELFDNIDWSTEKVFTQTLRNIEQQSCTFSVLPAMYDIDREEDLYQLKNSHPVLFDRIIY